MKKYLIFGLISGAVVSFCYPEYGLYFAFGNYIGLTSAIVRVIAFMLYAIPSAIIWKKLKVEFSSKKLTVFVISCIVGMFGMIGFQYLYSNIWYEIKLPIKINLWRQIPLEIVLKDAFNFANLDIVGKYISQLIMQIIPYIAVCKINKVIKNKKFIKTGEQ